MACTLCAGCAGSVPIFRCWCWRAADDASQKLEAIRLGARDYLVRPLQAEQLETAIRRSLFHHADSSESEILADEIEQLGDDMFFVAASPTMRKLRAQAELLAQVSAPVFIQGENGSGKDLAACLIHKLSVRSGFRFLKIELRLPARRCAGERTLRNGHREGQEQARQAGVVPTRHAVSG